MLGGKSILAFKRDEDEESPSSKRFGFVQTDDEKPKRRLFEVLTSPGRQLNQQITCLSAGSDTGRALQLSMRPDAAHMLDWHHVTRRLTVLDQYATGLVHHDQALGAEMRETIARLKWSLWHGNLSQAFDTIEDLESLLANFEETYPTCQPWRKAVEEFRTSIRHTSHLIPHYGARYRHGEAMATGFVASTVHQVVSTRFWKQPQMQWSKRGAHVLLQTRVKTLTREWGFLFKRWDPDLEVEERLDAASSPGSPCSRGNRLELHGEDGAIIGDDLFGSRPGGTITCQGQAIAYHPVNPFVEEVADFVQAIAQQRAPRATLADGLRNVYIVETAREGYLQLPLEA